jgi:hypothetical protein
VASRLKAKLATANAAFSEKHEAAARAVAQMDRDLGALLDAHGRLMDGVRTRAR